MVIAAEQIKQLHLDVLPRVTRSAFLQCTAIPFFSNHGWYLAGGTALALQVGHRRSLDLDFFTDKKSFHAERVERLLSAAGVWRTTRKQEGTLYGELDKAKISFIAYPFFLHKEPLLHAGTVSLLSPKDIAVMKIIAISQRGKKRDFFDLYWLSLNTQPLSSSIAAVHKQYTVRTNLTHILKSLVYFDDAENDPEPVISFDASWKKVKQFFTKEVPVIAEKLIR